MFNVQFTQKVFLAEFMTEHKANILQASINDAGQRLDNFLLRELGNPPKGLIYKLLRGGQVRVNGGRKKPVYRLEDGDLVRVPPNMLVTPGEREPAASAAVPKSLLEKITAAIAYEDDRYLILNKPPGLAVHGGSGQKHDVLKVVKALRPEHDYWELGHRIDRYTSGALLLAKSRQALTEFHDALQTGRVTKRYQALAAGQWPGDGWYEHFLDDKAVVDERSGKLARSHFQRSAKFSRAAWPPLHLLTVTLDTGRTHQIRLQTQALGCALLADDKYGDRQLMREARKLGCRRMFLHAAELAVDLGPERSLSVHLPLAEDLQRFLDNLQESEGAE